MFDEEGRFTERLETNDDRTTLESLVALADTDAIAEEEISEALGDTDGSGEDDTITRDEGSADETPLEEDPRGDNDFLPPLCFLDLEATSPGQFPKPTWHSFPQ